MAKALAKYEAMKKLHLEAQAAYAGAKSEAAKASADYNAAVKAHCDAEALHAAAVEYIGHGQFKKDECKKHEAASTGLWPISKTCTWCNQGNWNYNVATQQACQDKAVAGKAKHYTYKSKLKQCRIDANSKNCKSHGKGYSDCAGNVHTHP